jgi:hypothetical protein
MHRFLMLLLVLGAGAPAALAQTGDPQGTFLPSRRHQGVMVQVGLGVAGCNGTDCEHIDPGASLRLDALYRFHRFGALGARLAFALLEPDADSRDRRFWNLDLGVEARGILPVKRFDLWVGLSLDFTRQFQDGAQGGYAWDTRKDGFALGFGLGIDLFVMSRLAVGVAFRGHRPYLTRSCSTLRLPDGDTQTACDAVEGSPLGIVWSLVVSATLYYGR